MKIRYIEMGDIEQCIALAYLMHQESIYRVHPFLPDKVAFLIQTCIDMPEYVALVAEHEGEIIGFMSGIMGENFFSNTKYANDIALYVKPENRGSSAAVRLITQFLIWSDSMGCDEVRCGITTQINNPVAIKLYSRFGFNEGGTLMVKKLVH